MDLVPTSSPTCTRLRILPLAAVALLLLAGCGDAGPDQSTLPPAYRVAERYAAALDVRLDAMTRRSTGLYVQDLQVGEGMRADSGDIAHVHYTGWLASGVEFDTSRERDPLEVPLGYGRVIAGWDQGVVGMKVGGRRRLVIPPALGYGEDGRGPIPRNATLVFDVELVDVVDRTSGVDTSP